MDTVYKFMVIFLLPFSCKTPDLSYTLIGQLRWNFALSSLSLFYLLIHSRLSPCWCWQHHGGLVEIVLAWNRRKLVAVVVVGSMEGVCVTRLGALCVVTCLRLTQSSPVRSGLPFWFYRGWTWLLDLVGHVGHALESSPLWLCSPRFFFLCLYF